MSSNKITITLQANTKDAKKNINDLEKEIKLLTSSVETQSGEQKKHYNDIQSALKEQAQEREKFAKRNQEIVNNTISNNRKQEESMKAMTSTLKTQLNELEQLKAKAQATQQVLLSPLGGDISKGNAKQKEQFAKTEQDLINHTEKIRALRKELTEVIRSQDYQELADSISTNKKLEAEQLKSLKAEKQLYTESAKAKKQSLEETYRLNKQGLADNQQKLEKLKSQLNQEINLYKERDIAIRKSMQGMSFGTTPELAKQSYISKTTTPKQTIDDKAIQNLKEQYQKTYELTSAQVKYNEAKKRLDGMLTSGAISQEQYNKGLATEGKLLKENKGSYESATNAVVRHLRQIETLIVSYYMLKGAWDATIGVGINVNRTIESNTQGIAALITANTRMTTSTGQAVTNQQKFAMSQSIAAETMKKIKTAAIDTAGTFEDLIMIFQQATGQTLSMGNSMGGSIKEIIDNTIQLSKRMANIAGAIGMPLDRVREEVRSLLSGNASTDSLISTMLFGSPSQANQAMEKAKASGKDGVKKLLDEMLAPFDVLEGLMTYDIQFNRMKDAYQSLAATTTKPIFDGLTQGFAKVANYLTAEKIESIAKSFENVGNAVATIVPPLVQVATYLALVKGGMLVWKNALPLIESATIGIVDFTRGTIDAETGLKKTGTAFTGLMGTLKANAPMLAIIAAYEAYNFLIGDTLDKEKRLHEATSLKLEDIKKLSLAQAQTGLADINVGLSEMIKERDAIGKQIMAGTFGKQNAVGEWTDFGKLSKEEIQRLQSQQDTIQAQIDGMYKTKELYVAAVNVASGIQTTAKAFGDLMTEGSATKNAINLLDSIKKPLTHAQILQEEIKKLQKSITEVTAESKDKTLDKKAINARLQIIKDLEDRKKDKEKELAEANKKESNKASSILNTEDKEKFNLKSLANEVKLQAEILEATYKTSKEVISLKSMEYDAIEKLRINNFDLEEESLIEKLSLANDIKDLETRQANQDKIKADIIQNLIKKEEYLVSLKTKSNDEVQKGIDLEQKRRDDIDALINKYTIKKPEDELGLKERLDANKIAYDNAVKAINGTSDEAKKKLLELDEVFKKSQERFKNENLIKQYKEDMTIDIKLNGFDEVSNSIASLTNGFIDMNNSLVEYNSTMADISKSDKEKAKAQQKYATDTVGAYGNMAGAIGSFYEEGSTQAKNFQKVQQAMYMAQMAMQMSALMTQTATSTASIALMGAETTVAGTLAVAKQAGAGDPYTAFARVAAMTALLASFGIIVGGALGGGDKTSTSYDTLSAITANTGTGTVLGDAEAGSNSIANSLEILSDLAKPEHNLLAQMNKSLISIDNKIGGVTTMLLRNAGYALGEGYTNTSTGWNNNIGIGSTAGGVGGAMALGTGLELSAMSAASAGGIGTSAMAAMPWVAGALVADKLLLDSAITGSISSTVGKISGKVFGTKSVSQKLTDYGLIFDEQLITQAKEDFEGSAYQTIATTTTKKKLLSKSSSTSYATYTEGMDEEIRNQFELILNNMYDTVVSTGDMLDTSKQSIMDRLDDYSVKLGKISLKGKTGEEVQELLSNVFGKTMDEMVTEAYAIQDFQYKTFDKTISDFQSQGYYQYDWSSYDSETGTLQQIYVETKSAQQQLKEAQSAYDAAKSAAHTQWLNTVETTLDGFQKVGETISSTLTRVASGMEEAEYFITRLGYQFEDIDYKDIINQQGEVGVEALKQSLLNYEEAYYQSATGIDEIVQIITGTTEEVYNSFVELDKLRNQLSMIGQDVNGITLSMISGAGGISELSQGMSDYFENFLTEAEQSKFLTESMGREFEKLNLVMPSSNDEFKALIQGLDLSTESGQDLFGRLILLSDGFNEVEEAQNGVLESIKSLTDGFTSMTDSIQETIDKLLGIESGNSQEQMIRDFWTRKDEADKLLSKGGDLTESELSTLSNIINEINSLSTNIQSSQVGDVSGITSSLVSELLGIKKDVALNESLVNSIYTSNGGTLSATGGQGILTQFLSSLPSYDTGTPYLKSDMVIQAHEREMIIDPQSSDVLRKYGIKVNTQTPANNLTTNENKGIIEAINKQTEEVKKLNARMEKIELLNKDTRDNTERMAIGA